MQTKSKIQLIREALEGRAAFCDQLISLTSQYNITNSVFICRGGNVQTCSEGLFQPSREFQDVQTALQNMDVRSQAIQVIGNIYIVGYYFENISNVGIGTYLDIATGKTIEI